jgi:hypothetical protein
MDSTPVTAPGDLESLEVPEMPQTPTPIADRHVQVYLKTEGDQLHLILPKPQPTGMGNDWDSICQGLKFLLNTKEKTWTGQTPVCLLPQDRLLDTGQ